MPGAAVSKYFDATENRKIRDDLLFAVQHVDGPKTAIDCGCGAGADINYLVSQGFFVHGFDVEEESIARCKTRFQDCGNVALSQASFSNYNFPAASLVVADASLFFCSKPEFPLVWERIHECLLPNGIFCGSFLGPEDTMASPAYKPEDFWPDVAVFEEHEVIQLFANYELLRFNVHRSSGTSAVGEQHHWHLYSIVARKQGRSLFA